MDVLKPTKEAIVGDGKSLRLAGDFVCVCSPKQVFPFASDSAQRFLLGTHRASQTVGTRE